MNSKIIARYGIIAALVAVGIVIDSLLAVFTPVTPAAATLIIVIVVCQTYDLKTSVYASTVFGILSLIRAFTIPNFLSETMQNPLISVLPRIIIGFTCYLSFVGFKKIFPQNDFRLYLPYIISGAVAVITNTSLVLGMMFLFKRKTLQQIIVLIVSINTLIEFLCSVIVVPAVSVAIKKSRRQ